MSVHSDGFDWSGFEERLFALLQAQLSGLAISEDDPLYVVALHGVDREHDEIVSLPLLAANTVWQGSQASADGFWDARWNPADWLYPEIVGSEADEAAALELEKALTAEASRGTTTHWERTVERYFGVLVRLTERLRDAVADLQPVTDDVVVFWFDEEGGFEVARQTIPRRLQELYFAPQLADEAARKALAKLPPKDRAALLVTRLGNCELTGIDGETAQAELRALGGTAVPALVGVLDDPEVGWTAAMVLGQIGVSTPEAIGALRAQADAGGWHAMALGMLGDQEWLTTLDPAAACAGLTAPLRAITCDNAVESPPLDYRPLERWLDAGGAAETELAEETLAPGRGSRSLGPGDLDEALRGLRSEHAVVRWHAASCASERSLGHEAGRKLLPALAEALGDPHPFVRRLAVLAIGDWKSAAKPYLEAIRKLRDDEDEVVARVTDYVLGKLDPTSA